MSTLWVGALWAIGYIAAPVIFSLSDDRALAGDVAGTMFYVTSIIGMICGILIWLGSRCYQKEGARYRKQRLLVLIMLILVAIGQFYISPMLSELRTAGIGAGSSQAERFAMLHGLSSGLYLIVSLLGIWLVWTQSYSRL